MKLGKSTKYNLRGVRLALFGFIGTILVIGFGYLLRSWLDKEIENKVSEAVQKKYPPIEKSTVSVGLDLPKSLIGGSFSDTFSGTGWLAGSNIYQDRFTTGLTPFPNIDLKSVSSLLNIFPQENCPQNLCLVQSGNGIYVENKKIELPEFEGSLVSLDIQSLADTWILGLVSEKDKILYGYIYILDGGVFKSVSPSSILETRYGGRFAFAGDSSRWLAVYGSYEGRAWEYKSGELRDLSYLLNPRVMRGGFTPEIFQIGMDWFVGNLSGGFPLLKFFSGRGGVVGALDLTNLIDEKFSEDLRTIKGKAVSGKLFLELIGPANQPTWFELLDFGFSYSGKLGVVSNNLRVNQPREVVQAKFLEFKFYPLGAEPSLFLANSNDNWRKAKVGEWVEFPSVGEDLYWRADFSEISEPFFADLVKIEYGLRP